MGVVRPFQQWCRTSRTGSTMQLILLDGSFEIRGESLAFEWRQSFACDVTEVQRRRHASKDHILIESVQERSSPWREVDELPCCIQRDIPLCLCSGRDGHANDEGELNEIAAALCALKLPGYDLGGF